MRNSGESWAPDIFPGRPCMLILKKSRRDVSGAMRRPTAGWRSGRSALRLVGEHLVGGIIVPFLDVAVDERDGRGQYGNIVGEAD